MKDIDKTKENIRIDELDDIKKKELFNKFVDAGGEVLSERQKKRNLSIDREKQAAHQQRLNEHYSRQRSSEPVRKTPSHSASQNIQRPGTNYSENERAFMATFRLRMQLRFQGITGFNTIYFKKSFLQKFSSQYKPALLEIQLIYFFYFKKNLKTGNRIAARLDKARPLYFELVEKVGDIFNPMLMNQINEHYQSFPDISKPLSELIAPMIELFREIHIVKPYENMIFNAFEKTMELYVKVHEGDAERKYKTKDVKNSLYIIFHKLYPKLHTLFSYYQGDIFTENDPRIDDILSIALSEKPGNRLRQRPNRSQSNNSPGKNDVKSSDKKGDETVSEDQTDIGASVKTGLNMMYNLDLKTLRAKYDKKGLFAIMDESDKILTSYLLFLEFTSEYSFILTTNKIKYHVDFTDKVRIDYRHRMQDLFNELRKCEEAFAAYAESYENYNKMKLQRPLSNDQYIAYSKRVDSMIRKKDQIGSMARMVLKSFMQKVADELAGLVKDNDEKQKYILNPQDVLEFSYDIEGDKKLNNTKIYEALIAVHSYTSALAYRLGPAGDLSGKLEFSRSDIPPDSSDETGKEKNESGSILDELDDIL